MYSFPESEYLPALIISPCQKNQKTKHLSSYTFLSITLECSSWRTWAPWSVCDLRWECHLQRTSLAWAADDRCSFSNLYSLWFSASENKCAVAEDLCFRHERRANYGWCLVVEYMWVRQTEFFYTRGGPPSLLVVLDGVWSWDTYESSRQNSFTHVVVLQAYCWWCGMVFGHGIHVSQADRILLHTWWSSKLIVGGVVIAQSLSRVQLFATPWTTACQAPLSSTPSPSLLKLTSSDSVMLLRLYHTPTVESVLTITTTGLRSLAGCSTGPSVELYPHTPDRSQNHALCGIFISRGAHNFLLGQAHFSHARLRYFLLSSSARCVGVYMPLCLIDAIRKATKQMCLMSLGKEVMG